MNVIGYEHPFLFSGTGQNRLIRGVEESPASPRSEGDGVDSSLGEPLAYGRWNVRI